MQNLFCYFDIWTVHLPFTVALAVVATVGYLFGRVSRNTPDELIDHSKREMRNAQTVIAELEKISWGIRKSLARHHSSVIRFKDRVGELSERREETAWKELCCEAEEMLKPTLKLAAQIANAYDEIRQQSANLMKFTEVRTDPLTRVRNRRALDDVLQSQFALMSRYETSFSLFMLDVDNFKHVNDEQGHLHGDKMLQDLAQLIDDYVRETDMVARYGGDEFVVVMPQTDLEGACMLSERLRFKVQQMLSITVSGGISSARKGDTQEILITRADQALYQAKASGRNLVYQHDARILLRYRKRNS